MPDPVQKTEAEAVAEIARKAVPAVEVMKLEGFEAPVIAHEYSKTRTLESLERFMANPIRKRAQLTLRDHSSFIDYVQGHKEPGTIILAELNENGGSFTAIIDYHHAVSPVASGYGVPRFGDHVCKYVAEHTPEWKRWIGQSGKPLSQTGMALFIEDNMFDIIEPAAARMLELVKTLEATQGVEFKSAVRLQNGDRQLHYAHQTTAKAGQQGDMEIPEKFTLRFGVFVNGPVYDIPCRFRYSIKDGALLMAYEVERPHKIIDLALSDARTAIVQTTQLPVLLGSGSITKA